MAKKTVEQLKALWITGYRPTESDFDDLFDSYKSLSEPEIFNFSGDFSNLLPTSGEIDTITGTDAVTAGTGYMALIKNTSGAQHLYLVASNGISWYKKDLDSDGRLHLYSYKLNGDLISPSQVNDATGLTPATACVGYTFILQDSMGVHKTYIVFTDGLGWYSHEFQLLSES